MEVQEQLESISVFNGAILFSAPSWMDDT